MPMGLHGTGMGAGSGLQLQVRSAEGLRCFEYMIRFLPGLQLYQSAPALDQSLAPAVRSWQQSGSACA